MASVLNEIGVGGLNIDVATDNKGYLKDLVADELNWLLSHIIVQHSA